jgi:hypothetical protein
MAKGNEDWITFKAAGVDPADAKSVKDFIAKNGADAVIGKVPLFHAVCTAGDWEAYQAMREAKVSVSLTDEYGNTALHSTVKPKIVEDLLKAGLSPNTKNTAGVTPTYVAGTAYTAEGAASFNLMLDKGGDPTIENNLGVSAASYMELYKKTKHNTGASGWRGMAEGVDLAVESRNANLIEDAIKKKLSKGSGRAAA